MLHKAAVITFLVFQLTPSFALMQKTPISTFRSQTRSNVEKPFDRKIRIIPHADGTRNNSPGRLFINSQIERNVEAESDVAANNISVDTSNLKRSNDKVTLAKIAGAYLASLVALAKLNIFSWDYTDTMIIRDTGVSLLTSVLALIFVKIITKLSADGVLQPRDSRKIIHTLSAPLFILCWPLFSDNSGARFFAAFVPMLQACRLWLAGTKVGDNETTELANAISRSGDKEEALGGPLIYVLVLFSAIILCFCDNLTGVIALSTMATGDGMADIIGRRFGKNNKWFFSKSKSMAGTLGFAFFATLCSTGLGAWLMYTGAVQIAMPFTELFVRVVLISVVSSLVELLPIGDDNWSVPISAAVLASTLIQQ